MVSNLRDEESSSFIDSITNIQICFGPILEIYWSNLRNGYHCTAEYLYLIGRRQLLPDTESNHGNWSHFQVGPEQTSLVRPGSSHGIPVHKSSSYLFSSLYHHWWCRQSVNHFRNLVMINSHRVNNSCLHTSLTELNYLPLSDSLASTYKHIFKNLSIYLIICLICYDIA